jgi:hypothetical protein
MEANDKAAGGEEALLSSFERLLGRQASEEEKIRLLRTKDVLNLRDNDALWMVLMALEEYAYQFDRVPAKIQKETEALVEGHKKILEAEAVNAAEKSLEKLSSALAKQIEVSMEQTSKAKYRVSLGWSVMALVLLSVLCFVSGFVMGGVKAPWWTRPAENLSWLQLVVSSVLMAPAGWVFSLLAVPCVGYHLYVFSLVGLTRKAQAVKIAQAALSVLAVLILLYWTFVF